jgi:6-phosphogluconolactonase
VTPRTLIVCEDKTGVIERVARDARLLLVEVLTQKEFAHVALTGGSVGIGVLEYLGKTDDDAPREERVDWSRVQLWWGDERWLATGDAERNDVQAQALFLGALPFDASRIHRIPASDAGLTLDDAAHVYAQELAALLPGISGDDVGHSLKESSTIHSPGQDTQSFDLVFLGVGPDAHVASLFPGRANEAESSAVVIPVRGSPKPPPERISLTLNAINSAARVWLVTGGGDKADAIDLALGQANLSAAPASAVSGRRETRVYCDRSARRAEN